MEERAPQTVVPREQKAEQEPEPARALAPRPQEGARLRRLAVAAAVGPVLLAAFGVTLVLVLRDPAEPGSVAAGLAFAMLPAIALAAVLGWLLSSRLASQIEAPVGRTRETLSALVAGDLSVRTGLTADDGAGAIGHALDRFLDERVTVLQRGARDSEELNDSVIEIMQAVGAIASSKDLTIRVPVTENVTGAIADALNMLTEEIRRVLFSVGGVSQDVAQATVAVKSQSDNASQAASREQREVDAAARELAGAAVALNTIADLSRTCRDAAERASVATGEAMQAVASTVQGIARSRGLIRETEKRIKRLGERSQEIGQVVGLISGIAERTGILALNASMHAAAAGDAGRSFAAVADEVKRLSESAREATSQIGRLVTAIQVETGDTVLAMSQAISQVVEISRLAEEAGGSMRRTQEQTGALASDVRDIARTSTEQAKVGAALLERAKIIKEASAETAHQLSLQHAETLRLIASAKALLDEVRAFTTGGG